MVSLELMQSWARTTDLLNQAIHLLSPELVQQHATALEEIAEFLDHNELGVAFIWLQSVAQESQWDSIELLKVLFLAAENMKRIDDASSLQQRLIELADKAES